MTVTSTTAYASTSSYLTNAYGRTTTGATTANGWGAGSSTASAAATLVTLSAQAQAKLAAGQSASIDTVVADTRSALDALYAAAGVTGPLADGKQTVDLKSLDRRGLYAIASNTGGKFSADEQAVAKQALQSRFDAMLAPQCAVARLTGDWSRVYQAAIAYMQGAGSEEKASATYAADVAALQAGYAAAQAQPDAVPSTAGDPVADFLVRAGGGVTDGSERAFGDVAKDMRTALDAQKQAAADHGLDFTYGDARRTAATVDWSEFDNRSLSAVALNEGDQFSAEEVWASKRELDTRTRTTLLTAFQQAGSGSDPRSFSLGLLYTYQTMGEEERQATNFTTNLRDLAVSQYQSTTSLISMLQQAAGTASSYFG
jgi:hypothetical protein